MLKMQEPLPSTSLPIIICMMIAPFDLAADYMFLLRHANLSTTVSLRTDVMASRGSGFVVVISESARFLVGVR
jgi:hypothetical protein